jgi:hypothetical protein
VTSGTGSGATANITVDPDGTIHAGGVVPSSAGAGYAPGDLLTTSAANIGGGVLTIVYTGTFTAGTGYTTGIYPNIPLVYVTSGAGSGATANITVDGLGHVTVVTPIFPGVGYTVADSLTATFANINGGSILTHGTLVGGSSYNSTNSPYSGVPLTGGTGTGATANITVVGGSVLTVAIASGGLGYTVGDTLSADNSYLGGSAINILDTLIYGSGYTVGTYYNVPLTSGHSGTGAQATIIVSRFARKIGAKYYYDNGVTSVTITNRGTGYMVNDLLSASNTHLGGTGIGFSITVRSVFVGSGFTVKVGTIVPMHGSGFSAPVGSTSGSGFTIAVGTVVGSGFSVPVTSLDSVYTVTATGADTMASMAALMAASANVPVSVVGSAFVLTTGTNGTLPTGLDTGVKYTVTTVSGGPSPAPYTFQIQDQDTLAIVDIFDIGQGSLAVVPAFTPNGLNGWIRQPMIREKLYAVFDIPLPLDTILVLQSSLWQVGDTATVYKNGVLAISSVPVVQRTDLTFTISTTGLTVSEMDIIDVIRPVHNITPGEASFNPDVNDDGTVNIQWKHDYEYTTNVLTAGGTTVGTTPITYYYFWVQGSTNSNSAEDSSNLSPFEAAQQLQTIPTPYFVVQKPQDDPAMAQEFGFGLIPFGSTWAAGTTAEQFFIVPVLYRQAILRNIVSYITDDNRYVARFIRNFTLRDNILANGKNMNLKDVHEEWFLFRQNQTDTIPVFLWNRLIEALIGYTILDPTIRVPSLERQLYDEINGTATQYGIDHPDQAFVDSSLALPTVLAYLRDPNNSFYPVDMNSFFIRNNFNTSAAIYAAMIEIYNTFPAAQVNAIWFSTLQDALTTQPKYKSLMKTSWVALHGVRVLGVNGIFDD